MKKILSVIIVTYNSKPLIFDCLDSIYKFNDIGDALEVIIVDNNSDDQDAVFTQIRKDYPEDILLVKNLSNSGYGTGNNLGVEKANANHFIVVNPDVRLIRAVFSNLLTIFDSNSNIGILGVTFLDKSGPFYFKPEYYSLTRFILYKVYIAFNLFDNKSMYLSGSFLMFDKQTFIKAGGFDSNYFLYYEEPDISNRVSSLGKDVVLKNDIKVLHLANNRSFNPNLVAIELESLNYYLDKYKFDKYKVISKYLQVFQFKYFIATLLFNKPKKVLFSNWVNILKKNLNS